ncbi:hypothetical protein [Pantoea sp. 1B4]|uniref:hypothetical protein n=1 Tax=Pantoea sp. 1B4 TaxID=2804760 RepID=UPI001AA912F8|nr:hypothetical protein [Pantoea sp. 1B4]MBN1090554.1 hypothetical protein [Pantoea sp. 1B4]
MMRVTEFVAGFSGLKTLSDADRKSAAEWGVSAEHAVYRAAFFLPDASELVKIGMQLLWGACVSRAAFLANGGWKKKRHGSE